MHVGRLSAFRTARGVFPFFYRETENRTAVSAPTVTIRLAVADPVTAEDKPIFHRPPHLQKDLILIAAAATKSLKEGRPVKISEIE